LLWPHEKDSHCTGRSVTTKTLGQIASETMVALLSQATAEECAHPAERAARWEAVAQAVATLVRARCAQEADNHMEYWIGHDNAQRACENISIAIRDLLP
jgi:hypothetical protein